MSIEKIDSLQQSLNYSKQIDSPTPNLQRPTPLRISIKSHPLRDMSKKKHQVYSAISIYDPESKKYQIRKTVSE